MRAEEGRFDPRFEAIAVYWRQSDGKEMHFRRDGRLFWRHPSTGKFEMAVANTTFELIEEWIRDTPAGSEFQRVEPAIEVEP